MAEVIENSFWETDLSDLPGAIEINDDTKIISQGVTYTQKEIDKGVDDILNK